MNYLDYIKLPIQYRNKIFFDEASCVYCKCENNEFNNLTFFFNTEDYVEQHKPWVLINLLLCDKHNSLLLTFPSKQDKKFISYFIDLRRKYLRYAERCGGELCFNESRSTFLVNNKSFEDEIRKAYNSAYRKPNNSRGVKK